MVYVRYGWLSFYGRVHGGFGDKKPPVGPAVFDSLLGWLHLDFDVAAGRQAKVHERVDGLGSRVKDIDQALVNAHLELFTALLIDMGALYDRKSALAGRQWDRAGKARTGTEGGVYDLLGGLVNDLVVIGL